MTTHMTATLADTDQALFIAEMPQLAGNGHQVDVDGDTITLSVDALAVLADLAEDNDGHYDGREIWLGGIGYPVRIA